ncbi:FAD-dependent oxidoreductase [Kitasatospora sp. NPDC049285]|uniref:FAD-dependent oxidoreductase n=1 Tax=Kitasatospora sp. NPDC049285 TaxID=3157096 RepID=UPI003419D124
MSAAVAVTVVGAGPYGLAVAAHLRGRGVPTRVFGEPMGSWRARMPIGMFLKSTPAASSISSPRPGFGFNDFRRAHGERPVGARYPIPVAEFIRYGEWFQRQCVPDAQNSEVVSVTPEAGRFLVRLADGESFESRAVVLATGFPPYAWIPPVLRPLLEAGAASHSSALTDPAAFAGRRVAVVGAGQSALEGAALLSEAGASPVVVARRERLLFGAPPPVDGGADRPLATRLRSPVSPLGPGWPLMAFSRAPAAFRHLPDGTREHYVRTVLGPAGAWWLRERVDGVLPVVTGRELAGADLNGAVRLSLTGPGGPVEADHVLVATGFRVDVSRLAILDPSLRAAVRTHAGAPRLSAGFESSVPGLYFTGLAAADAFGPVMRFVCGTGFAAGRLSRALAARRSRPAA